VQELTAEIRTDDGVMNILLAKPDGSGPFPAAVLFHHVGGLSETMRVVARRIAAGGFLCAVPALYYRLGDIVIDPMSDDERVAAIRAIAVGSLSRRTVMADTRALLDFLAGDRGGRPGLKGCLGIGGLAGYAFQAAASFPDDFAATAAVLGNGFVTSDADSPHLAFPRIRGELYFSFAGDDEILPAANIDILRAAISRASAAAHIVVHAGVRHGYAFSNRAAYEPVAAEADWSAILAMFERQLAPQRERRG
jgi:carboxymethylenebutenolidase